MCARVVEIITASSLECCKTSTAEQLPSLLIDLNVI